MIQRTFDAAFVNRVVNHLAVVAAVRGPINGYIDLEPIVADHRNFVLVGEGGFAIFAYRQPGVYEWHGAVLPKYQGKWAVVAAGEALDWLFAETDAVVVLAPVPANNRSVRVIVGILGFQLQNTLPSQWPTPDGPVDLLIYTLQRREWTVCQ